MIRIIVVAVLVAVDFMTFFFLLPLIIFHVRIFFPFRFRYLQENAIEELPIEGFNGLFKIKILYVTLCL